LAYGKSSTSLLKKGSVPFSLFSDCGNDAVGQQKALKSGLPRNPV
jgi:hypothetical protein